MKHLKSFNENLFESEDEIQEIVNNCKDILLDLKDDGFEVKVKYNNNASHENSFTIMIAKDVIFTKKDIADVFNHLKSYMESVGYVTNNEFQILRRIYTTMTIDVLKKTFIKKKVNHLNENFKKRLTDMNFIITQSQKRNSMIIDINK